MATNLIDTADINLVVPLLPAIAGSAPDFSGGRLTAALTPMNGGPPIVTVASDDPANTIAFVPASSSVPAHFTIDMPIDARDAFTVSVATAVFADVKWFPDPTHTLRCEWVGRIALTLHPGSDSAGIAQGAFAPVLLPVQPYGDRSVSSALLIGPQGAPAYPAFNPITDEGRALRILGGVPTWV